MRMDNLQLDSIGRAVVFSCKGYRIRSGEGIGFHDGENKETGPQVKKGGGYCGAGTWECYGKWVSTNGVFIPSRNILLRNYLHRGICCAVRFNARRNVLFPDVIAILCIISTHRSTYLPEHSDALQTKSRIIPGAIMNCDKYGNSRVV